MIDYFEPNSRGIDTSAAAPDQLRVLVRVPNGWIVLTFPAPHKTDSTLRIRPAVHTGPGGTIP